jgi:hypothetical protein
MRCLSLFTTFTTLFFVLAALAAVPSLSIPKSRFFNTRVRTALYRSICLQNSRNSLV